MSLKFDISNEVTFQTFSFKMWFLFCEGRHKKVMGSDHKMISEIWNRCSQYLLFLWQNGTLGERTGLFRNTFADGLFLLISTHTHTHTSWCACALNHVRLSTTHFLDFESNTSLSPFSFAFVEQRTSFLSLSEGKVSIFAFQSSLEVLAVSFGPHFITFLTSDVVFVPISQRLL